ncbi:hypothetical protein [Pseudorhodoferax sp. Leaf274]|uniref:hypothetical protein n=1 Tax=Pseudorhodoferax sp. Leaf274 TaxID=1736318 RepID=UPI000702C9C1|nr:hypothetical protein [Pseudorhodoferax sp. Leaf274]KQP38008.1 hypothetical protein ASF44_12380 [Pseudorhodoferax sp. Leaf274]
MHPQRSPEPRPRRSGALLLAALLALAGLLWAGRADLPAHLARWTGGAARAQATLDYARLSPTLDAAALARQLDDLPLQCQALADGSACEAALAQANGLPAALLRASWQQGRLQAVDVLVPWWAHHRAVGMLTARLGAPGGHEVIAADGQRIAALSWSLPEGTVQVARAPGWNPLHWTALRWNATPPR